MPAKHSSRPPAPNPGYETRDASPARLTLYGTWMTIGLIATLVATYWVFFYFRKVERLGPAASPFTESRTLPPLPRLQVAPVQDLQHYRQQENEILNSYGWVDRQGGGVRIPIERAIELTLQRGLPARALTQQVSDSSDAKRPPSAGE